MSKKTASFFFRLVFFRLVGVLILFVLLFSAAGITSTVSARANTWISIVHESRTTVDPPTLTTFEVGARGAVKFGNSAATYTLSVSKADAGSGIVTSSPAGIDCGSTCLYDFAKGTVVTLTAVPSTGSTFSGWSGCACSVANTCTVTMTAMKSVVANFKDNIRPTVSSITRVDSNPSSASNVNFTVTFSEPVTGVDMVGPAFDDFALMNSSGISGASITGVSGSGVTFTVTVNTGSSDGTIRLDVPVSATVTDLAGEPLGSLPFTSGESYTINKNSTPAINCANQSEIPVTECDVLLALYNSTNGANWTNNTGWSQTNTPCTWYGVTCTAGHVTELYIAGNNLVGPIPAVLGDLSGLIKLTLAGNQLSGSIPTELGNLTGLTSLELSSNLLSGSIPAELGNLTDLTRLNFLGNQLSGSIPTELGNLINLNVLGLESNQLSGPIPPELGNLTNLIGLALGSNQLSGPIPPELGNLTNLTGLHLINNQLTGSIPTQLGNLTQINWLELDNNQLSGSIPIELSNLTQLQWLGLGYNQLSGSIPSQLGNLTNLTRLVLAGNQLTGSIPSQLGNLANLTMLALNDNQLTGSIPTQLGNLINLTALFLHNNQLTGSIPAELGNLKQLEFLKLSDNQLTGSIPSQIGNLTNLLWLYLDGNRLSGEFPTTITNLTNLTALTFDCWITSTDSSVITFIQALVPSWQNSVCLAVLSITRSNPNPTSATNVSFTVTFSKPVTGVDMVGPSFDDFTLTNSSGINGTSVTGVSGSGATYTVTVSTGNGDGTIRLDMPASVTITDLDGNPLANLPFIRGDTYIVNKPPPAAVLIAPIGDIGTNYNPTYTWDVVSAATYYRLYVSLLSGTVILDQWVQAANVCNTTTCSVAGPMLEGGAYTWWVQTWNTVGYGPWSNNSQPTNFNITSLTVPAAAALIAPIGDIGTNYNPTYTWNKVSNATWYRLYVSLPSGTVILDQWVQAASVCNATTCSVAGPTLEGGAYTWWVQTWNTVGYGPWSNNSQPTNFNTTIPTVPAAAVLIAPIGDIGTNYNPTYTWNKVANATWYRLYVSLPSGTVILDQWVQAASVCNVTTCSVAGPTLEGGAYTWWVQTWNTVGYGPWSNNSQPTNFNTTIPTVPAAAVLSAPSGMIANHTPTYQWNKVDMATWYRLYVSGPSGVIVDQWIQAASVCNAAVCSVISPLLQSGDHTWWLQTYNAVGYGPWVSSTFKVNP